MRYSKIFACLLCLAVTAGTLRAQDAPPSNSAELRRKIEAVSQIYQSTLERHYQELISSLDKDIEELRKVYDMGGTAETLAKLDAQIKELIKERDAAAEKARALRPDAQTETAASKTGRPADGEQLPPHCPAGANAKKNLPPGVIWCAPADDARLWLERTDKPTLSAQEFAEYAAPILWFSPNEPLFNDGLHIPEPLPGDPKKETKDAVVYYRISEVLLQPNIPKSQLGDTKQLQLEKIKGLTLKYYFYYSKDVGLGEHLHDLESVRYDVHFTLRQKDGVEVKQKDGVEVKQDYSGKYYVAHISRVIGAAHGVTWYGNQLDIGEGQRNTSLPITLLIEEGKHATIPDRNADGFYSPGYDVNRRYTDAWGVRDLLGSGALGSARYEGAMTKPRRPGDMVRVDPVAADPALLFEFYVGDHRDKLATARRYKLTPARSFETEDDVRKRLVEEAAAKGEKVEEDDVKPKDDKITGWMKREKFGRMEGGESLRVEPKPTHGDGSLLRAFRWGMGVERNEELLDAVPFALRTEGRQYGFTFLPPVIRWPVPKIGGYLLPKMNFMFPNTRQGAIPGRKIDRPYRFSLEALYTPSAARTFDWYVTSGAEWSRPVPGFGYEARLVNEGGLRFRFNGGDFGIPLLIGGRLGMRITGFAEARQPRLIFELGTGAF